MAHAPAPALILERQTLRGSRAGIVRALGIDADSPWPTAFTVAALAVLALRTALAVLVEQHRHRRWPAALSQHPGAVPRSPPEP